MPGTRKNKSYWLRDKEAKSDMLQITSIYISIYLCMVKIGISFSFVIFGLFVKLIQTFSHIWFATLFNRAIFVL